MIYSRTKFDVEVDVPYLNNEKELRDERAQIESLKEMSGVTGQRTGR